MDSLAPDRDSELGAEASSQPRALVVRLELEQPPCVTIEAASHEDEIRLLGLLSRSGELAALLETVTRLPDELDESA